MIKPSELLQAADNLTFKHYIFYGYEKLPEEEWHQKFKDGSYGVYNLNDIDYESAKLGTCGGFTDCYDYGKAIQSICWGKINANFVAKILDSYFKVREFDYDVGSETLYIRLKRR